VSLESELMEILCADCGCLVDRGVRITVCSDPNCCCNNLPIRESTLYRCRCSNYSHSKAEMKVMGAVFVGNITYKNRTHRRPHYSATPRNQTDKGQHGFLRNMGNSRPVQHHTTIGQFLLIPRCRDRDPGGPPVKRKSSTLQFSKKER
jgi:hypothetical protein